MSLGVGVYSGEDALVVYLRVESWKYVGFIRSRMRYMW